MSSYFRPQTEDFSSQLFPQKDSHPLTVPEDDFSPLDFTLLDGVADAVLVVEGETIVYANLAFCALMGVNPNEENGQFRGQSLTDVLPRLEATQTVEICRRPWPPHQGDGGDRLQVLTLHLQPPTAAAQEKTWLVFPDQEKIFRILADTAPVMIWVAGQDAKCFFFNQTWLDFTGRSLAEEQGEGWAEGIHSEDFQHCLDTYLSSFALRQPFQMEYRLRRRDGEYRWLFDTGVPRLAPDGEFLGYIGSCVDITDRKRAESALQKRAEELAHLTQTLAETNQILEKRHQELDQLAYVAAHDLKAPVVAITNLASWIVEDAIDRLPRDSQYHLQLLQGRVQRLDAMIEGLLDYGRIGRGSEAPQWIDFGELVQQLIEQINPEPSYDIQLESEISRLYTERSLLAQVLSHLIGNALIHHHRPQGQILITAHDRGQHYEFAIQDDGPGIAPDYHDRIFGMFQILRPRDQLETIGIGLAVVKKIVEAKGGRITLQSGEGEGACFRFSWPKSSPGT